MRVKSEWAYVVTLDVVSVADVEAELEGDKGEVEEVGNSRSTERSVSRTKEGMRRRLLDRVLWWQPACMGMATFAR